LAYLGQNRKREGHSGRAGSIGSRTSAHELTRKGPLGRAGSSGRSEPRMADPLNAPHQIVFPMHAEAALEPGQSPRRPLSPPEIADRP
jgi:hypothetical protein